MEQAINEIGPRLRLTNPVRVNLNRSGETKFINHGRPFEDLFLNILHGKYQYVKLIILISNFILIENFYITQQRTIEDVYPENFIVDIGENIDEWISNS